jgi:hypothetical protein
MNHKIPVIDLGGAIRKEIGGGGRYQIKPSRKTASAHPSIFVIDGGYPRTLIMISSKYGWVSRYRHYRRLK